MLSIRDLTASPGQKVTGNVLIGMTSNSTSSTSDSSTNQVVPITILNGIEDGPTVLVLSGIHGSEYIPIFASQRLGNELDPSALKGSLILVHIANLAAFLGRTVYTNPIDGKNLNRVFPGNSNGTLTEQIAHFLVQEVYPLANYVLDMHSGDANEQLGPSYTAYYGKAGSPELIAASKAMAIAFGLDLVVEFQWELVGNNSNAIWAGSAAVVRGIPSIDVEMAPGMGRTTSDSIDEAYTGVLRVMDHLDMFETKPVTGVMDEGTTQEPCLIKERYFVEAPLDGSWTPLVDAGTFVAQGTSMGYVTDFHGRATNFEPIAPSEGLLIIRYESPPVVKGDTVAVIAVLNTSDSACSRMKNGALMDGVNEADNNIILWQWTAAIGWLVALVSVMWRPRRHLSHQPHVHRVMPLSSTVDEFGTEIEMI